VNHSGGFLKLSARSKCKTEAKLDGFLVPRWKGEGAVLIGCSVELLGKGNPEYPGSISLWESLSHTAPGGRR